MKLLEILLNMQKGNIDTEHGICSNISKAKLTIAEWEAADLLADKCFESWPQFTGSTAFPVPSTKPHRSPSQQYIDCQLAGTHWEGEQGRLRHSLLTHMIKELSNEVT
ncbi:MAG: hypothetical protein HRU18_06640 [Pseudoalteromonas sp.]|uniref:hypothetical protein n=1 Tax=Pseudoalteromonas sp. TaxID=53249 RepID=UPI001D8778EB|nr:hypothetical protein [Pseudoalteromonas sp.]NRA77867.1 hypothetical protein [Pseudoalteromonas sp.]